MAPVTASAVRRGVGGGAWCWGEGGGAVNIVNGSPPAGGVVQGGRLFFTLEWQCLLVPLTFTVNALSGDTARLRQCNLQQL